MKKLNYLIVSIIFSLITSLPSLAVVPTFDMSIRNVATYPNPVTGADSILTFDVFLQWTNPGVSDPFEYSACQGAIYVDHQVFNGGVIYGQNDTSSFSKFLPITSDLPFGSQPPTTQCIAFDGARDLLQFSANVPNPAVNFFISTMFPGTRIMKFKLRTNAHIWGFVFPGLRYKINNTIPGITLVAYFLPPLDPGNPDDQFSLILSDTINNNYITESNFILPVELNSFSLTVSRNNISLNWSTVRESNNMGFDIERKSTGTNEWTKVGYVSGSGTAIDVREYSFTEKVSTGKYNYRLKQIDYNGNSEYFNLRNDVEVGLPTAYSISQNYPNPFNPSTKIDFELPYDGKVSILLYDISGREVGELLNEIKPAGFYTVKFNASGLSSGIYFYRINAEGGSNNNFISTKRMMLIK